MENVNDEGVLTIPEKSDSANNVESEAMPFDPAKMSMKACSDPTTDSETEATTSEPAKMSTEDSVIVPGKEREETMKDAEEGIIKINSEESVKWKNKRKKIALGGASSEGSKVEGSGMIFMCSSKTKKDCFLYKVLGMPESKKDVVSKIYKGMRLFLFDIDLKLMYGIYKATGRGGYNIEPKAFSSAYPSQVRFTVLDDCSPLAEEKFKSIIKDNYYTRNKFSSQLTSEQVKKLCKLFQSTGKGPKPKRPRRDLGTQSHSLVDIARNRLRDWEEKRRPMYHKTPEVYEREALASPGVPLPAHLPALYAYSRAFDRDPYRVDRPPVDNGGALMDLDHGRRIQTDVERGDPYIMYREPVFDHDGAARAVGIPTGYRQALSSSSNPHPARLSYPYRI